MAMRPCPQCSLMVSTVARRCRGCGSDLCQRRSRWAAGLLKWSCVLVGLGAVGGWFLLGH
ncbi:hypothetical protein MRB56_19335 [Halomonas cupida]|uniref:hypothetical protein n=1 Tax=Halomonas cupida TaxID=44933 RepID=UPI001160F11D|nr:hypothetical protein [Halomonas cupida]